jgi:hypothetical protein
MDMQAAASLGDQIQQRSGEGCRREESQPIITDGEAGDLVLPFWECAANVVCTGTSTISLKNNIALCGSEDLATRQHVDHATVGLMPTAPPDASFALRRPYGAQQLAQKIVLASFRPDGQTCLFEFSRNRVAINVQ